MRGSQIAMFYLISNAWDMRSGVALRIEIDILHGPDVA